MDMFTEIENATGQPAKIAMVASPIVRDIVRKHQREEDDRAYEQRCEEARRDRVEGPRIAEAVLANGNVRESDQQFEQRSAERRKVREQVAREAASIAEAAVGGVGGLKE